MEFVLGVIGLGAVILISWFAGIYTAISVAHEEDWLSEAFYKQFPKFSLKEEQDGRID